MRLSSGRVLRTQRQKSIRVPIGLGADPHIVFLHLLKQNGIPTPVAEYTFAKPRRWRFDYAWPGGLKFPNLTALEIEGGAFSRGRHTRGKGFIADMEKYNEAAVRGWIILRVTPQQLCQPSTLALIQRALAYV